MPENNERTHQQDCPLSQDIGAMKERINSLHTLVEDLQEHVKMNTYSRIASDNFEMGRKVGISKAIKLFNYLAHFIGSAVLLGLLIAAGNTIGFVDAIVKIFSRS